MEALRQATDRAWRADVAAWAHWSFRRTVERRRTDAEGKVVFRNDMESRVTPQQEGFDEEPQGKAPSRPITGDRSIRPGREYTRGEAERPSMLLIRHRDGTAAVSRRRPSPGRTVQ